MTIDTFKKKGEESPMPYRMRAERHRMADSLGLDRRKARQNKDKTEEMCTKAGKRTTNWENPEVEVRCHTKAINRPQQKIEVSKIANASTFEQEKRRLQGCMLKGLFWSRSLLEI